MEIALNPQFVAEAALLGMGLESVGGLYLAYDLLGGKRGPLRAVTRATGYAVFFMIGYSLLLGVRYAIVASVGMGVVLAFEFGQAEKDSGHAMSRQTRVVIVGFLRGLVLGAAAITAYSFEFGLVFGALSGCVLTGTYFLGFAPADNYLSSKNPTITSHMLVASLLRGVGVSFAGVVAGLTTTSAYHSWILGLRLGLAAGAVSAIVSLIGPVFEWRIDNLPERRLGLFGIVLIFVGSAVQSIQYWIVVFGVKVQ
jgi:hypothetical protein